MTQHRVEISKQSIDFDAIFNTLLQANIVEKETIRKVVQTLKNNEIGLPALLVELVKTSHDKLFDIMETLCRISGNSFDELSLPQLRSRFSQAQLTRLKGVRFNFDLQQQWVNFFKTIQPEAKTGQVMEIAPTKKESEQKHSFIGVVG